MLWIPAQRWPSAFILSLCTDVFLTQKADLSLLQTWRPVTLFTTDYKVITECQANRWKHDLHFVVYKVQSYCIPDRSIMILFLVADVLDQCRVSDMTGG